jgi:hypothetical protein
VPYKDPEVRKAKHKEYSKKHYESNKEKIIVAAQKNKKKARVEWRKFKATLSCEMCGQNHPATLDFHHTVKDKSNKKVSHLTRTGAYLAARQEITKCSVLCANCHRIHHHEEKLTGRRKKKKGKGP